MYYQRRKRLRRFGILALVGLALAARMALGDDPKPALDVRGDSAASIGSRKGQRPSKATPTKGATKAAAITAEESKAARKVERARLAAELDAALDKGSLQGDAALRGALDLTKMTREGDGFSVPLPNKRRALLTIDPVLQEQAQKLLVRAKAPKGAIVVMKPDGTILALAGRKQGPPAVEDAPELATEVWAPAASVFKIVTAAALLNAGVGADDKVCFHGGLRSVMKSNLVDDPRKDGRCESLSFAVAESNNAIVGKLAHKHLDKARLEKVARSLGFGDAPDFALESEASRIEPPDDELEFAKFSAGFWASDLSALDGALLTNAVASGGMRVTPRIVAAVIDQDGKRIPVTAGPSERAIAAPVARAIGKMMVRTTETGTAARVFRNRRGTPLDGVQIAGKTGSLSVNKPSYLGISWFVAYAPADKPEVIVSVVLGNAELWWIKAHQAARVLLEKALPVTKTASK